MDKIGKNYFWRFAQVIGGLVFFSVGVYLAAKAAIGLAPWDVLAMGASYHLPLSYGKTMVAISLLIFIADILLKEQVGFGMLLDAIIVGNVVDLCFLIDKTGAPETLIGGCAMMIVALFIEALGQVAYIGGGLSCGPRDCLLLALGKRLKKVPIGVVQIILQCTVLFAGWLLGGPIGIGTIIAIFAMGTTMQIVFRICKFEPRDIQQENFLDTYRKMRGIAEEDKTEAIE